MSDAAGVEGRTVYAASQDRTAGIIIAVGFLGILATCVTYLLSPPAVILPLVSVNVPVLIRQANGSGEIIRLIAIFGIPGDVIGATGCILLAIHRVAAGHAWEAGGWLLAGLSDLLFTLVDTTAGYAIPALATTSTASEFGAVKVLLDGSFVAGTWTFALGGALVAISSLAKGLLTYPRPLLVLMFVSSAVGIATSPLVLYGVVPSSLMAATITVNTVLFMVLGILIVLRHKSA